MICKENITLFKDKCEAVKIAQMHYLNGVLAL